MLFNSFQFFFFFLLVYFLYRKLDHRSQNWMLLFASYIFYGWWDWRFLGLIWLTTLVDYYAALQIDRHSEEKKQKFFLILSLGANLGVLGFFKYFNFFAANFEAAANLFGWHPDPLTLKVVLPVGISFYTFQSMSYTIDVYRRRLQAERNLLNFALYVAFFPQLMAGPIERGAHMLPQFAAKRTLHLQQSYEGCWLIFWGLFKKVFVADNLAKIVNAIFSDSGSYSGGAILMGVYAFAFQIYGDFSGYSDMARGLAKLLGIELNINFKYPYFVTNPREFWKNWHISLSSWLKDYLYIPLGGNQKGEVRTYINLMLTMFLGGLWHGAAWTFVLWGLYQGTALVLHRLLEPFLAKIEPKDRMSRSLWFLFRVLTMFHITCFGWLIFRAESVGQIGELLQQIIFNFSLNDPTMLNLFTKIVQGAWLLLLVQIFQKLKNDDLVVFQWPVFVRAALYTIVYYFVLLYGTSAQEFIYFQF